MILSKGNIQNITLQEKAAIPNESYFNLPEKVLQFGTGVLLRGLPDYFIDKANKKGIFNGRIVVVKSTTQGSTDSFSMQDGLYTTYVRGIENGNAIEEICVNASISRVLSAKDDWQKIIGCASIADLRIILSNTTEVGIVLVDNDNIHGTPPVSFPGKLLAFLYKRFEVFAGAKESGLVIIPTELIPGNGEKLKSILIILAKQNDLGEPFIQWMDKSNYFCSSLVDRIVPGKLMEKEKIAVEQLLGYNDELLIVAEPYRLWAIESQDEKVKEILSFQKADDGVVIEKDISKFRELKLRLLNGTHTFCCGLAVLSGFSTVKEAMANKVFREFVTRLMLEEIAPVITGPDLSYDEAREFGAKVIDRFCNPYIEHEWLNITFQYSSKMAMRNVPLLQKHYSLHTEPPLLMALGFAGYILFMRSVKDSNGNQAGNINGSTYIIKDDKAPVLSEKWKDENIKTVVKNILADTDLWGIDLVVFPGFAEKIAGDIMSIINQGADKTIIESLNKITA
jgi:tagaturonate reductase